MDPDDVCLQQYYHLMLFIAKKLNKFQRGSLRNQNPARNMCFYAAFAAKISRFIAIWNCFFAFILNHAANVFQNTALRASFRAVVSHYDKMLPIGGMLVRKSVMRKASNLLFEAKEALRGHINKYMESHKNLKI